MQAPPLRAVARIRDLSGGEQMRCGPMVCLSASYRVRGAPCKEPVLGLRCLCLSQFEGIGWRPTPLPVVPSPDFVVVLWCRPAGAPGSVAPDPLWWLAAHILANFSSRKSGLLFELHAKADACTECPSMLLQIALSVCALTETPSIACTSIEIDTVVHSEPAKCPPMHAKQSCCSC